MLISGSTAERALLARRGSTLGYRPSPSSLTTRSMSCRGVLAGQSSRSTSVDSPPRRSAGPARSGRHGARLQQLHSRAVRRSRTGPTSRCVRRSLTIEAICSAVSTATGGRPEARRAGSCVKEMEWVTIGRRPIGRAPRIRRRRARAGRLRLGCDPQRPDDPGRLWAPDRGRCQPRRVPPGGCDTRIGARHHPSSRSTPPACPLTWTSPWPRSAGGRTW